MTNIFAKLNEPHYLGISFVQFFSTDAQATILSPVNSWKEKTIFPKLMNGKSLTLKARPSNLCKNDHLSKEQKRKEIEYSSFIYYFIYRFKFHRFFFSCFWTDIFCVFYCLYLQRRKFDKIVIEIRKQGLLFRLNGLDFRWIFLVCIIFYTFYLIW